VSLVLRRCDSARHYTARLAFEWDYGSCCDACFPCFTLLVMVNARQVRPSSVAVVRTLRSEPFSGRCALLTGDRPSVAAVVGKAVGVDACVGGMTPTGKKDWVVAAQADGAGKVLMVGDGINDGPALAAASVGVAMAGGGTALAITNADVALLDDDLNGLLGLLRLSFACRDTIWTNIAAALAIKVCVLVLAVAGAVPLWGAVVADVTGLLLVVANGMRLLGFDFAAAASGSIIAPRSPSAVARAGAGKSSVEMPSLRGGGGSGGSYQPLLSTYPQGEGLSSYGTVR